MHNLVISPLAKADMREIGDYISNELRNPIAAKQTIQRFQKAILPLQKYPEMGAPLLAAGTQDISYRFLVCGSYLIFYHLGSDIVLIDRVLYGRRDYLSLLFDNQLSEDTQLELLALQRIADSALEHTSTEKEVMSSFGVTDEDLEDLEEVEID